MSIELGGALRSEEALLPCLDEADSSDLPVGKIVRTQILECGPETSVSEAARLMSEARYSSILISEGDQTIGIWTERDALTVDFSDPEAYTRPVREVMSAPVHTTSEDTPLREVVGYLRHARVRHLVVLDAGGRRKGIVSLTDVVLSQGIEHYLRLRQVDSVISRPPIVLDENDTLLDAARAMREQGVDAVVIGYADGDHGILTERDVVRFIAARRPGEAVGRLASRPLISTVRESSLLGARGLLVESRLRHLGVTGDGGELIGLVSFFDILSGMEHAYVEELKSALHERDRALVLSRRNLHLAERIIESSPEGIMITDAEGRIQSVNPAFTKLTGYSAEEVIGKSPSMLSSGRHPPEFYAEMWGRLKRDGHWNGEIWNRRKNGDVYPELLTVTAIRDEEGNLTHYAALFSDISEMKESEEHIRHLAYYDPLTGLPNRRLLNDRLQVAIAHARRHGTELGVLFVDLDRFKRINDSLGHGFGDEMLRQVASRIGECIREDDTVARMGGDEFVVILFVDDPEGAATTARRIIDSLKKPVTLDDKELVVTCSIGISIYPEDGTAADTLISNADSAMYRAKDTGRNSYQLYAPAMNARSLEHLALESGLRRALERGELRDYYQFLIDTKTRKVVGVETLVRWQHPELGLVPPADFIPLAEETGLIIPIGEWVLRAACRQLALWQGQGRDLEVAINISARQFHQKNFAGVFGRVLEEEGVNPENITVELTESMLMDDALETIRILRDIREMGMTIAVDDFGTGYSSLNYLKRFPINKLKIDRSFIRDMHRNADDAAIVSAVIGLAHSLGQQVVAEGVENEQQVACLREMGCELLQGYLFCMPAPADKLVFTS